MTVFSSLKSAMLRLSLKILERYPRFVKLILKFCWVCQSWHYGLEDYDRSWQNISFCRRQRHDNEALLENLKDNIEGVIPLCRGTASTVWWLNRLLKRLNTKEVGGWMRRYGVCRVIYSSSCCGVLLPSAAQSNGGEEKNRDLFRFFYSLIQKSVELAFICLQREITCNKS